MLGHRLGLACARLLVKGRPPPPQSSAEDLPQPGAPVPRARCSRPLPRPRCPGQPPSPGLSGEHHMPPGPHTASLSGADGRDLSTSGRPLTAGASWMPQANHHPFL